MKFSRFILTSTIIFSSISLSSCKNSSTVNLVYGNMEETLTEINYTQLTTMVNDEQSFILGITSSSLGCTCWSTFKNLILTKYQQENHVMIYYINHQEFYDANQKLMDTYGIKVTQDPGFAIFGNGNLKYNETYSAKNYMFSDSTYFNDYMKNKVSLPKMFYISKDQLDAKYKGNEPFTILYSRNNCGDCKYVNNNFLKQYGEKKTNKKPLYILEIENVKVKVGGINVSLREYDNEGKLTEASSTRWQNFKDEYGLSNLNNPIYGYNSGYVPTFLYVEPDGVNKAGSVNKDGAVYFNETVENVNGEYVVTDSYYSSERSSNLHYVSNVKTNVLTGMKIESKDVESNKYVSWKHEASEKYYTPLLQAFLDKYLA